MTDTEPKTPDESGREYAVQVGLSTVDWDAYPDPHGGGQSAAEAAEEAIRAALNTVRIDVDLTAIGDIHIGVVLRAAGLRPTLEADMEGDYP